MHEDCLAPFWGVGNFVGDFGSLEIWYDFCFDWLSTVFVVSAVFNWDFVVEDEVEIN